MRGHIQTYDLTPPPNNSALAEIQDQLAVLNDKLDRQNKILETVILMMLEGTKQ